MSVGPACMSSSVVPTSRDIGRQHANTSGSFSTSLRARQLSERTGWFTLRDSATSTRRSICSRDTSLISERPVFYLAIGGDFKRIFLPTQRERKYENFFQRYAAAQVANIGAGDEAREGVLTTDYTDHRESRNSILVRPLADNCRASVSVPKAFGIHRMELAGAKRHRRATRRQSSLARANQTPYKNCSALAFHTNALQNWR
jgi:hypothetical protein